MELIIIIFIGFTIIMVYDIVGSILSRILNFEYVWLTFGSFFIYGLTALYLEKHTNLLNTMISSFLLGVFDSTVGLLIAKKLNAKISDEDKKIIKITPKLVIQMGLLASIIAIITILIFS